MAEEPGLLDSAWEGWKNWWDPKTVPEGASYDPQSLGIARAEAIGTLGGKFLALAQGGLQPAQRAAILASVGDTAGVYQDALSRGTDMRLKGAQAENLRAEIASQKASDALIDAEIARRAGGGTPTVAPGNLPQGGTIQRAMAALLPYESGGRADAVNSQGFSGRYQMGSALATAAGVYRPASDEPTSSNAWRGSWVIPGFDPMSHQQFLANPAAQERAAAIAMQHNWNDIQAKGLDKYVGQTIDGVQVTPEGLLQGAWLGGTGGLRTWLEGRGNPADSNKTTVGKYVGLRAPGGTQYAANTPPGGQVTMNDSSGYGGPGYDTPPGGATGGPGSGPGLGRGQSRGDLSTLTPQQLTLLRGMKPAERSQFLLQLSQKENPYVLNTEQKRSLGLNPGSNYQYTQSGGVTRIDDAPAVRLTPAELAAGGYAPGTDAYRKSDGTVVVAHEPSAVELTPAEKAARGFSPDAVVTRKPDGTISVVREGNTRLLNPAELKAAGYNPDAQVQIGPDQKHTVINKGTSPTDAMSEADAQAAVIKYGPAARAGTLDPNSPEGLRYKQAVDLIQQPRTQANIQTANTIHGQMIQGDTWRNYAQAMPVMTDLREQLKMGTGASDLAMIIDYAKLLDPNSVVRGQEGEEVRRTGGVFDTIQSMIQQVQGNGKLSPTVRQHLIDSAEARFAQYEAPWRAHVNMYRERATKAGVDPDLVWQAPPAATVSNYTAQPLPEGHTVNSLVAATKDQMAKNGWTRLKAEMFLKQYGIGASNLD